MSNENQNIIDGFNKFRERIKPAAIVETGKAGDTNSKLLGTYVVTKGYALQTLTADQIADALFQAASDDSIIGKLAWIRKPVKLTKVAENEKGINLPNARAEQDAFAEKAKKAEADKANQKAEDAAQKATVSIIASFKLESARKTEESQKRLRARVSRLQTLGSKWTEIESDTRQKASELYTAAEREVERVGIYRDLLSEVEV